MGSNPSFSVAFNWCLPNELLVRKAKTSLSVTCHQRHDALRSVDIASRGVVESCVRGNPFARLVTLGFGDSYLVDPASSHMLVSKTKPCKSKYKQLYSETADGSLKQL